MAVEVDAAAASTVGDQPVEQDEGHADEHEADAEHEVDDISSSKPRKKRRIIKATDKKYECPHLDCGKSYSRAEHLYRHQLNHTPKQIYRCDFPGCDRSFVRADLCARHKERHTAKGSHLQRKDAFLNGQRPASSTAREGSSSNTAAVHPMAATGNHVFQSASDPYTTPTTLRHYSSSSSELHGSTMTDLTPLATTNGLHLDSHLGPYNAYPGTMNVTHHRNMPQSAPADDRRFPYDANFPARHTEPFDNFPRSQNVPMTSMQAPVCSSQSAGPVYAMQNYSATTSTNHNYRHPSTYSTLPTPSSFSYPPPSYGSLSTNARSGSMLSPTIISSAELPPSSSSRNNSVLDFHVFDQMVTGYAMPVFGSDTPFNRSPPPTVDENFLNMLFNANDQSEPQDTSPSEPDNSYTPQGLNVPLPKLEADGSNADQALPSLSEGFNINTPQTTISEKKQGRLLDLVQGFGEISSNHGRRTKTDILAGNSKDPNHVMSLQMLKTYISSFWFHLHQQIPILHRPTFNPETCPDLLLLAVMCLGATCLERTHSVEMTKASAEWAFFVAYHIRWEIFKDADFKPTAKLWTFQSMLFLELFEKMFSTRSLHETGHVHHATTLSVMRRGSSLIGRNAIESPGRSQDPTRTPPGPEGSINTSGQNTNNVYWNRWITAEATRRAAFAAFIIDASHATLFGHSAIMSPHEVRLPLPCDEALWSATSSAEVQRLEANLPTNGGKSPTFLDGLRRTLNGQKVRTNTFGRVILMTGLLNVSWHMNQRDLQVSSLNATSTLGSQIKWRSALTRAFDFWRKDFDESLSKNDHWLAACNSTGDDPCPLDHREIVFESRTCLHSLAHMAMHVDIIDCQVFAGADLAIGRMVTEGDRAAVQRRMREQWAPSARARDAVFYALRFLCEVMIPEEELSRQQPHKPPTFSYSPRHDYLLNRPWVLYFATLIVWSYGYALDGPIKSSNYMLTSRELQVHDMQRYLIRMGGVASPDDLERVPNRNSCLGLLLLLREKFVEPRWELMHEAGETLSSCIEMLLPGNSNELRQ